jgi:multicomponent Na+:H+ antiporter subunit B
VSARANGASVAAAVLSIGVAAAVLWPLVAFDGPWPRGLGNYLETHGLEESGARNLVSAIYLGYRAYDTLGETIVLLVAVSGAIGMIAAAGATLAIDYSYPINDASSKNGDSEPPTRRIARKNRTELIEVVTGKLGPVVLLFGFYVMLFGHVSPGGGFQGGVVVASGIVFLALGSKGKPAGGLSSPSTLAKLEAAGFAALITGGFLGVVSGTGFFAPPIVGSSPLGFIVALNTVIGLKVGAGIGFLCVAMLGEADHD